MHTFSVWAPRPAKVSVKVNDTVYAMEGPDHRGNWTAQVEAVPGSAESVAAAWGAWRVATL